MLVLLEVQNYQFQINIKHMANVFIEHLNGKINITLSWEFTTVSHKKENAPVACYIPAFDIYFSSPSVERAMDKSKGLVQLYTDHFMHNPDKGVKAFALQLHRLGFKANNDSVTLMRIIKNESVNAKFKSITSQIPEGYDVNNLAKGKLEMAI